MTDDLADGAGVRPASNDGEKPGMPRSLAVKAQPVKNKEPPPEKPSDIRRRSLVILSFWLIVLILGLPIWWKTTTIYRAELSQSEMLDWATGKACRPAFDLQISIQANGLQHEEAQDLVRLTQHALDETNDFHGHHLRLQASSDTDFASGQASTDVTALIVRLQDGETATVTPHPYAPILDITYPRGPPLALATYIAEQLHLIFAEERAIMSHMLSTSSASPDEVKHPLEAEWTDILAKRTTRSVRYSPSYHLTFSLFTSGSTPSTWEAQTALQEYMKPVLEMLRPLHNFTIDFQVQLYATPGVQSQSLTKQDLSSFINAAEWPLSPSIDGAPTINFAVYVGNQTINTKPTFSDRESEMDSVSETAHSWLIPQWGTVHILSLPADKAHVTAADLRQPVLTFTTHLLSLLGSPSTGSLPMRLSSLSRIHSLDLLLRASGTLGSLARLATALKSIAIPASVADGVDTTMRHLRLACSSLGTSQGLAHARIAEAAAEKAFFEKSMVGQLYFPDEHKIAVYLPLLGPICVPLVMGLMNEFKSWRERRRLAGKRARELKSQ